MEEKRITFDVKKSVLTSETIEQMAKKLLNSTESDFEEIKNCAWYKKLLNAVTLGIKDKKFIIKDVHSLADLQTLFLKLYMSDKITLDEELDEIVNDVQVLNEKVLALYRKCILHLSKIESPKDLSPDDQQILLWFLTISNQDGVISEKESEKCSKYNLSIKSCCNKVIHAEENPNYDMLKGVKSPKVFYRCAVEQAVYTFGTINFADSMKIALNKLSVSEEDKKNINTSVEKEVKNYTLEVLVKKYNDLEDEFDLSGFETEEISIEPEISDSSISDEKVTCLGKIKDSINKFVKTGKIGKSIIKKSGDAEKEIAKLLPTVLPKTVAAITKVKNGNLVFTVFAMYYVEKEYISQIKYSDISEEKISIDFDTGTFSFQNNDDKKVKICNEKIDAKTLQKLLCGLQTIGEFPNSDTAVPIKEMSEESRTSYLKLVYYVVNASKYKKDYEIYKKAYEYNISKNWEVIRNAIVCDKQFESELKYWESGIQYPSEETVEVQMIIDICKILQYTADSNYIPVTVEKYFEKICGFKKEKENSIIKLALSEKELIEKRITFEVYKKILEGFAVSLGGIGISVAAYSSIFAMFCTISWFNFIPGVGTLLSAGIIGGKVIKDVFDKNKNKKFNSEELRNRLFKDQYENYENAIRDAKERDYSEIAEKLNNAKNVLCNKANLTYNVKVIENDDKVYDKIRDIVIKCIGGSENYGKLFSKLSDKEKRKLLSDMIVPGITEKAEDAIAYYNVKQVSIFIGSYCGIFFVKRGIYFKENPSSNIIYIPYVDMKYVTEHITSLDISTKSGKTIKCKGILFTRNGLPLLLNEIIRMLE